MFTRGVVGAAIRGPKIYCPKMPTDPLAQSLEIPIYENQHGALSSARRSMNLNVICAFWLLASRKQGENRGLIGPLTRKSIFLQKSTILIPAR
jgi:hypothetical protein